MIAGMGKYGTTSAVAGQHAAGGLPSYNFTRGVFDNWKKIDGTTMYRTLRKGREEDKQQKRGRDTCFGCIVYCKPVVENREGPYSVDPTYGGPEYETLAAFGSYCGVDDLFAIAKANELCNRYGMDTISCGATIAWAMELFEAGGHHSGGYGWLGVEFRQGRSHGETDGDDRPKERLRQCIGRRFRQGF